LRPDTRKRLKLKHQSKFLKSDHILNVTTANEISKTEVKSNAPLFMIRPGTLFDLKDVWYYRELLYFLFWRDILIRYKQTVLGGIWEILKPLSTMIIFTVFIGYLIKVPTDGVPYPLFYYSALMMWTFFAQSMTASSVSIINASNLVNKIYFPRILIPVATILSNIFDLMMAFPILILFMIYYGVYPSLNLLFFPLILIHVIIVSLGLGLIFAASIVRYRDLQNVLPSFIQIAMFGSPIIYPVTMIPKSWLFIYGFNPMAIAIEGFRYILFGGNSELFIYLTPGIFVSFVFLFFGFKYFQKASCSFADWI
jgi:lipopolysaccharide transport system permease protein